MKKFPLNFTVPALLVVALAIPSFTAAQPASSPVPKGLNPAWNEVSQEFRQRMEEGGFVGGTLWLIKGNDVLKKEHYGFTNLTPRRPVDDETIFHWASITKTFTGIAIMQLRDRGLLSLNDSVIDYLPALREVYNPYGPMEDITIRMLLHHTAGFRSPTWPWGGGEPWHQHEPTKWSQLKAMMPYTKIYFKPGTKFKYSNLGIIFLGEIIEQLSGDNYEVYIEKNIFSPLKMHRSYFDRTPYHLLEYRSNNYFINASGDTVANGLDFNTGITVSNGGLNAPVTDMLKYIAFLSGNCTSEVCKEVLSRSSLKEMWTPAPATVDSFEDLATGEWEDSRGLAFAVLQRDDDKIVGHTGTQKSFRSFFFLDTFTDVAAIGVFNTVGNPTPDANDLRNDLRRLLIKEVFPAFR